VAVFVPGVVAGAVKVDDHGGVELPIPDSRA